MLKKTQKKNKRSIYGILLLVGLFSFSDVSVFLNLIDNTVDDEILNFEIDKEEQYAVEKLTNEEINGLNFEDVEEWYRTVRFADLDSNGINDQLDMKLKTSIPAQKSSLIIAEPSDYDNIMQNKKGDSTYQDDVQIIVHFPEGEINSIIDVFKNMGGEINHIYDAVINGFSGSIVREQLNIFSNSLLSANIPFLIEEDTYHTTLNYYVSRNMNLRPYVWNNLSYDGDEYSAVAVIDTGIDESHNFFSPGYGSADYSYKVVGWSNQLGGGGPLDDNGHGSHCAGIITGNGITPKDGSNRTLATASYGEDWAGYMIPAQTIPMFHMSDFNVTVPGTIAIDCYFDDNTPGADEVDVYVYLYRGSTQVDSYVTQNDLWSQTLTFTASASELGEYSLRMQIVYRDYGGSYSGYCEQPKWGMRGVHRIPFDANNYSSGNLWKGVAPDTHLVGVKVMDQYGGGYSSDIINGINWAVTNKNTYNITVISLSLGGSAGSTAEINAVNNAVNNGIVTVVAAGNDGAPGNNVGSPGDADNVITVAAMNINDEIAEYSSSGGPSYTGNTIKPDITAPGGSNYDFNIFSVDSNDNDASGEIIEGISDDLAPMKGTSMATPAVAGAASLVIEAMGGRPNWGYTGEEAKLVKALLLMTATETYPLTREVDTSYSPSLNRGGKDIHEGYGRINVDAAIEAYTQDLTIENYSKYLYSSQAYSFGKHAIGSYLNLYKDEPLQLTLDVPAGADFDLYLYNCSATSIGEPTIIASSTSAVLGQDESINIVIPSDGKYFIVAKAVSGQGNAQIFFYSDLNPPELTNENVNPTSGDQSTLFNFSVTYTDQENVAPRYINLKINGTSHSMFKQDISDIDYTDGAVYFYTTYLQPSDYNYSFECADFRHTNTTTYSILTVSLTNTGIPYFINPEVNPPKGNNDTLYIFTVLYYDIDNNMPNSINITINGTGTYPMVQSNPFDFNAMDGMEYYYNTTLDYGYYQFQINCSDGSNLNNTAWIIGPEVNPFLSPIRQSIFYDNFEDGSYIGDWALTGSGGVNTLISGPGTYSAYHYGGAGEFTSNIFNLSSYYSLNISYWVQQGDTSIGSENPDSGEDFAIEYKNSIGTWVNLETLPGSEPGATIYIRNYTLPAAALHSTSQFRFRQTSGTSGSYDYWHFDNVEIYTIINEIKLLTPANESIIFSGLQDFTWLSLNAWFGSVNYTFQISNETDFSNIIYTNNTIPETLGTTTKSLDLDLVNARYYWRVKAQYNLFYSNWSDIFYFDFYRNNYGCNLTQGKVDPFAGSQLTNFNFSVIYTDGDNNFPFYINLILNSTVYQMQKEDPLDMDYTDGCIYRRSLGLMPSIYNYTFYFNCSDGKYSNYTNTLNNLNVSVENFIAPYLLSPSFTPSIGGTKTVFNYTVLYYDDELNLPTYVNITIEGSTNPMNEADITDLETKDGKLYWYTSTVSSIGSSNFQVICSDGIFVGSTGTVSGPDISPFIDMYYNFLGLNEIKVDGGETVELVNYGPDRVMTNWQIKAWDGSTLIGTYTFPNGWIFYQNYYVQWRESTGSNSNTILYAGFSWTWSQYDDLAVGLFDPSGKCVDWFQTKYYEGTVPSDAGWLEENDQGYVYCYLDNWDGNYIARTHKADTDKICDWEYRAAGSMGSANAGQATEDWYLYAIYPRDWDDNVGDSEINFIWLSINGVFGACTYDIQVASDMAFTNIVYEQTDIAEGDKFTTTTVSNTFSTGQYYWRVRPHYGSYTGSWSLIVAASIQAPFPLLLVIIIIAIIGLSVVVLGVVVNKRSKTKGKSSKKEKTKISKYTAAPTRYVPKTTPTYRTSIPAPRATSPTTGSSSMSSELRRTIISLLNNLPPPQPSYSPAGKRASLIANSALLAMSQGRANEAVEGLILALRMGVPEPLNSQLRDALIKAIPPEPIQPRPKVNTLAPTKLKICKSCGAQNPEINKFCTNCSAKFVEVEKPAVQISTSKKVCSNCGAENSSNMKFCTNCGNSLDQLSTTTKPVMPKEEVTIDKITCDKCGEKCDTNSKFCTNCGAIFREKQVEAKPIEKKVEEKKIPEKIVCLKCGAQNDPGYIYCTNCFAKLDKSPSKTTTPSPSTLKAISLEPKPESTPEPEPELKPEPIKTISTLPEPQPKPLTPVEIPSKPLPPSMTSVSLKEKPVGKIQICPQCGAHNDSTSKNCHKCNSVLNEDAGWDWEDSF